MTNECFDVVQFFDNGMAALREVVGAEEAVRAARHYTDNVATSLGLVERVMIIDGDDNTVFCWTREDGITFPPECAGRR